MPADGPFNQAFMCKPVYTTVSTITSASKLMAVTTSMSVSPASSRSRQRRVDPTASSAADCVAACSTPRSVDPAGEIFSPAPRVQSEGVKPSLRHICSTAEVTSKGCSNTTSAC